MLMLSISDYVSQDRRRAVPGVPLGSPLEAARWELAVARRYVDTLAEAVDLVEWAHRPSEGDTLVALPSRTPWNVPEPPVDTSVEEKFVADALRQLQIQEARRDRPV